ncbi:MAG: hypothetical protein O9318_14195 [Hylemonella sp.]|uniref:hypothetical protein n=1 Tax=Hylemonella sp. TaxID=2066020 RepID=UPI0022CA2ADF|nr:hypothetical protein [Hylemonella sp.]MCZ8253616.1 hypothetical protein [Hylemonella sp.]
MDSLMPALFSTQTPLLASPLVFRLYLDLAWGLVLGALALPILARWAARHERLQFWLPLVLLLSCLLPGVLSPAYWLGLALRAPSGLLAGLCAWTLLRHYRPQTPGLPPRQALRPWTWPLVLLGWLLLLDTFALAPFSVYAWGYAPWLLGVLALLGLLPALLSGSLPMSGLWMAVLLLHVLLRLPTGNAWDAVLDPALWIWLQVDALRRLRRSD